MGDGEEVKSRAFSELKGYCLHLLSILQTPNKSSSAATLPHFLNFLRLCPSSALQPFLEYTLFPLFLLLDASVNCRSSKNASSEGKYVSDQVAEGILECLEEVLEKCHLESVDQMIVVLKKLTYGALLSPSEASEEFRLGIIRCFKAVLLNLYPCQVDGCKCKSSLNFLALLGSTDIHFSSKRTPKCGEPKECLLAFLQSEMSSAAVGHWLSLLLKAADAEATRGHRGSAKLRVEALLSFRMLVAKVATADALAFYLPGVVSQLAKVLHVSRRLSSGAAGSSEAIAQAIRGLGEFLMIILEDDANLSELDLNLNDISAFHPNKDLTALSILEELRQLPVSNEGQSQIVSENSSIEVLEPETLKVEFREKRRSVIGHMVGSLHVDRTKDWLKRTLGHVDKVLCTAFPHIAVHPSKKVRLGLLATVRGLLSHCSLTLRESRLMLLECLFVLVCDDSDEVSVDAQKFLGHLFSSSANHCLEHDVAELFSRLIDQLPKLMLGSEESLALSHAQKLLALIYYSGPQLIMDHLLQSPILAARFVDAFSICLSQNIANVGSLEKLLVEKPLPKGYLQSLSDLNFGSTLLSVDQATAGSSDKDLRSPVVSMQKNYKLPRMPPWFIHVGSQKLYQALAGVLRLVGLSVLADSRSEGSFSVITDILLHDFRKLVNEIRMRECVSEGWQSWYHRIGSGKLLRGASTAACILNEMIYGMSDQALAIFSKMFRKFSELESAWRVSSDDKRIRLIDCVGSILHEYLSSEVWDLPVDNDSTHLRPNGDTEDLTSHFLLDAAMLHQVIIDGIGIFNMCLGKDFDSNGFLHSSLYLLLENLICSNFEVKEAADAVLLILASTSDHSTVGRLVVENSDYIIDSMCRQLRHLDLNRHVPNLLGVMLSYIGVAHKVLPLLDEPMRSVSMELEILGRHQHPDLTVPFLKAVAEIVKASKSEACSMPREAVSHSIRLKSTLSTSPKETGVTPLKNGSLCDDLTDLAPGSAMHMEQVEDMLFKLNNFRDYRRTVGSIAGSCLIVATPLIASVKQSACLVALDIVEDGIATLAKVEEAYRLEKETKESLLEVIQSCSFYRLQDTLDCGNDEPDENRLLPAMNKIWPFLVVCVRSSNPVAVRRCLAVVSSVVGICGGDFFSRRFHTDGSNFWKLLSASPLQKKPISKEEKGHLRLPYRSSPHSSEDSVAEISNLKVQVAALNMIAEISGSKRSASAMEVVLKKVSGLVIGIACSGVSGLQSAAMGALLGLAKIDPDLIWLLIADVYYSLKSKDTPSPPTSNFPEISEILPPPCHNGYLYVHYGGKTFGFDVDFRSVETVFNKLQSVMHLQSVQLQEY